MSTSMKSEKIESELEHALPKSAWIGVIGSGAMGAGIAQVAAVAGYAVRLYDTRGEAVTKALSDIRNNLQRLVEKGKMDAATADAAAARVHAATTLSDMADSALVVEAIVENLEVKRQVFAELETVVSNDCILATNTSSISITAIGAKLNVPERVVGMHFFNPVPLMALVEIISGLATDSTIAATTFATANAWGKTAVHTKSTPGFIVNRVARPYYAEGLRLLAEQAADVATIDAIMREAGGFRMGPFELMDLIGHDVNFAVTQSVFHAYFNDQRFTPSLIQQELVSAGYLGRKTGRGFYRHGDNAENSSAKNEASQMRPTAEIVINGEGNIATSLLARFKAASIPVNHHHAGNAMQGVLQCGATEVHLTDGRSATQRAYDAGVSNLVLFDLALDFGKATRIALSPADQCDPAQYQAVVGLFQAAGFHVSRIDDVPGMAVMRTVAMLANEAADTVNQGVCSAVAVDVAMQKGVNYPQGPLAWADTIGLNYIAEVLQNLADSYGEDRYRVSPLLRRKQCTGGRFHA